MKTLDKAVATDFDYNESTGLINALAYELSLKLGKQVINVRFEDHLDRHPLDNTPSACPTLSPSLETQFIAMATQVKTALEKAYSAEHDNPEVKVIIARWNLEVEGNNWPEAHIGLRVSIEAGGETLAFYGVDYRILSATFHPVDMEKLPQPSSVTSEEPVHLLKMADLKELCQTDFVDDEVLDSVSIAAHAIGWLDTDTYGYTMLLVG